MPFQCKICKFYIDKDSGMPYLCPNCKAPGSLERCIPKEINLNLTITEGKSLIEIMNQIIQYYGSNWDFFRYKKEHELIKEQLKIKLKYAEEKEKGNNAN